MMMLEEKKEVAKFFQKHAIRYGVKWLDKKKRKSCEENR